MQNLSIFTSSFSVKDYYPFGMVMPGRSFTSESYRFGFNGMEKDGEEWTGSEDSHLDFGARIYDSRLGRWMALDPLKGIYASISSYTFSANSPIGVKDSDGRLLTDEEGNIIYSTNGNPFDKAISLNSQNPSERTITRMQNIIVYANDGTKINALKIYKVTQKLMDVTYSVNGEEKTKKDWVDIKTYSDDEAYDCHGYTMLNGEFWLSSGEMEKLMKHDGYFDQQGEGATVNEEELKSEGKLFIYRANEDEIKIDQDGIEWEISEGQITHSAESNGNGELNSKNGAEPFGTNTNQELEQKYNSTGSVYERIPNKKISVKGSPKNGTVNVKEKKVYKALD